MAEVDLKEIDLKLKKKLKNKLKESELEWVKK